MWVLEKDGVTSPSKYNTKDGITKRLKEYKPPWEPNFEMYINDNREQVKFKANKIRINKYEPVYTNEKNNIECDISGLDQIQVKSMLTL